MFNFRKKSKDKETNTLKLVCWFEIPVFDFKRALQFYSGIFSGVDFDVTEFNGVPHAIFKPKFPGTELAMAGALVEYKDTQEKTRGPILFFEVSYGMDKVISLIKERGGQVIKEKALIKNKEQDGRTIIPKTLIDGNVGYYAYFLDTEGNKMGLYSKI